jgi:hypothetical protein
MAREEPHGPGPLCCLPSAVSRPRSRSRRRRTIGTTVTTGPGRAPPSYPRRGPPHPTGPRYGRVRSTVLGYGVTLYVVVTGAKEAAVCPRICVSCRQRR